MRIVIVAGNCGFSGGRLDLVAAVLKARGHDVRLVMDSIDPPVPVFSAIAIEQYHDIHDYRRERDYPTLREGLRNPKIKNRRI